MTTVQDIPTQKPDAQLLETLLQEQQDTTAVDRFSQRHANSEQPLLGGIYEDLIPLSEPRPGEQYAFEVDLDACSGCKACVAACHNLNGLDDNEHWRSVGLLHGGESLITQQQHVTTACHHCLEPGCLTGCPVKAYEKDPVTGIVRHLDDQCFGCQYCILMCPYEVPQYSKSRGIVRKCDMCHERLAEGEAPACVQACPTHAIKIRTVEIDTVKQSSLDNNFLPTTPDASITKPTTSYNSTKTTVEELQPADWHTIKPQHNHLALVVMLVITQISVGIFLVSQFLQPTFGISIVALGIGILGMNAALLHLGRPQYAYRAFLGLRTSWLSREILAFGIFAGAAFGYVASLWLTRGNPAWGSFVQPLGGMTAFTGLAAVFCSAMIYAKTQRPYWILPRTLSKFVLTSVLLGLSGFALLSVVLQNRIPMQSVLFWLMTTVIAKILLEASTLRWLKPKELTAHKKIALLLTGELKQYSITYVTLLAIGGLLLPWIMIAVSLDSSKTSPTFFVIESILAAFVFLLLLAAELIERYLFFAAAIAPKMPGGLSR